MGLLPPEKGGRARGAKRVREKREEIAAFLSRLKGERGGRRGEEKKKGSARSRSGGGISSRGGRHFKTTRLFPKEKGRTEQPGREKRRRGKD